MATSIYYLDSSAWVKRYLKEVGTQWVENIPHGAFVLFQSTDMVHPEHINRPLDLDDFTKPFLEFVEVLESAQINFDYPDKSFNRYMLFGTKK